MASYALGRNNGSQRLQFWGATGVLADRSLRGLAASLGRDAAAAPDLGRLAPTADALAGPFDFEMASCRRDTPWSSARYIALAPALCGRMSRLSRFRLRRRRRCVPRHTKKTATNSVTVWIPARCDKRSQRGLERLAPCGLGLLEQVLREPGRQIEEFLSLFGRLCGKLLERTRFGASRFPAATWRWQSLAPH